VELLNLEAPHGTAWELLVVVVVIVAGPVILERLRVPGIIGLLIGGCLLGPNVLGVVSDTTGIVKELGEIGLLYLMFVAGLELDLGVFARFRNQAIGFSLLTFAIPLGLGTGAGFLIGYEFAAAVLLGSLFASYTLVVYPAVRNLGLAANRAVAVTVGATVITDTLALVVLAAVAGSTTGDANGIELGAQIVLGLALLAAWCFGVLPRAAQWFFAGPGRSRTLRYVFALGALLSGAVAAEVLGIEGIVGAFFAGLALNRLVPNESEFMERIEFFGAALLIPVFLVSVGTVIDPVVMVDPGTLGLAGLFVVACVGGKAIAASLCRPLFRFTWDEVGVVFGLSVAQAAATLAATFVGLQIGLFTTATVNAVMIVIVVSLVLASTSAERSGRRIPKPPVDDTRLGRSVLVHFTEPDDAGVLAALAGRIARADAGVVRPVVIAADGQEAPSAERIEAMTHAIEAVGVDAELEVRHDRTATDGVVHAAASFGSSLVLVPAVPQNWLPSLLEASQHQLVATCPAPTGLVRAGQEPPRRVVLALNASQAARPSSAAFLAAQLAARLRPGLTFVAVAAADPDERLREVLGREVGPAVEDPLAWMRREGRPSDVVVIPGGRNGALASARLARHAIRSGATVVVVADPASVAAADRVAAGLNLVPRRATRI
jgi:Kef-type K+ transport system membrane component KefB